MHPRGVAERALEPLDEEVELVGIDRAVAVAVDVVEDPLDHQVVGARAFAPPIRSVKKRKLVQFTMELVF